MTKEIEKASPTRLYSLDALRGFDMFWITGGGALAIIISKLTGIVWLGEQMHHVKWAGFQFEDLIFPLFMFIAGVAIPFSVKTKLDMNVRKHTLFIKVLRRMVILVLLGIIYNGVLGTMGEKRFASVLGQIGVSYFFASLIVIYFNSFKSRVVWLLSLLAGYTIIQLLVPVPGVGVGVLTPEGCINGYIDRLFLPGKLYRGGVFDPEGLLCMVSATAITLMGTIAGNILSSDSKTGWQKIGILSIIGATSIILALILSPFYPIIKSCWTTTFNLLAGGISFLLLAFFYMLIDHWGFKGWSFYFRIIGMNSIFIYLLNRFVNLQSISKSVFGWITVNIGEEYGNLIIIAGAMALSWLLLYYMYRKKISLKV